MGAERRLAGSITGAAAQIGSRGVARAASLHLFGVPRVNPRFAQGLSRFNLRLRRGFRASRCQQNILLRGARRCPAGPALRALRHTRPLETGSPNEFSHMTDEELEAFIYDGAERIVRHKANGRVTR